MVRRQRRRLVDYPENDFTATDLAIAKVWFKHVDTETLHLLTRSYLKSGTYSLDSKLYGEFVANVYNLDILKKYKSLAKIAEEKAKRVWKGSIVFFTIADAVHRYLTLYTLDKDRNIETAPDLDDLFAKIKESIQMINSRDLNEINIEYPLDIYLWFLNIITESEVVERVLAMLYTLEQPEVKQQLKSAISAIEERFGKYSGAEIDLEYIEEEVYKALLMRAAELRGQYINKLRNAIIAITDIVATEKKGYTIMWREIIRDPMLRKLAIYIGDVLALVNKPQTFRGFISGIIGESEDYQSRRLKSMLLLSAIVHKKIQGCVVTPADMLLRILSRKSSGFFLIEEISREICGAEAVSNTADSAAVAINLLLQLLPSNLFDVAAVKEYKYSTLDGRVRFDSIYIYDHNKILEYIKRIVL